MEKLIRLFYKWKLSRLRQTLRKLLNDEMNLIQSAGEFCIHEEKEINLFTYNELSRIRDKRAKVIDAIDRVSEKFEGK